MTFCNCLIISEWNIRAKDWNIRAKENWENGTLEQRIGTLELTQFENADVCL